MEIVVQVCDECQVVGKPVLTYTVGEGDRAAQPVLCADDARPLERYLTPVGVPPVKTRKAPAKKAAVRPAASRSTRRATIEEIEAMKRK